MKIYSSFSILFWVNLSRTKNREASLYVRITENGKMAAISLNRKVLVTDWDSERNRVKDTGQKSRILNTYSRRNL